MPAWDEGLAQDSVLNSVVGVTSQRKSHFHTFKRVGM